MSDDKTGFIELQGELSELISSDPLTPDQRCRLEALIQANNSCGGDDPTEVLIARAEAFHAFITGGTLT